MQSEVDYNKIMRDESLRCVARTWRTKQHSEGRSRNGPELMFTKPT